MADGCTFSGSISRSHASHVVAQCARLRAHPNGDVLRTLPKRSREITYTSSPVNLTYNDCSALLPKRIPKGWTHGSVADYTDKRRLHWQNKALQQ